MQCYDPAIPSEYWTLNEALPNGEDKIRYRAEEAVGAETRGESEATIKVAKTLRASWSFTASRMATNLVNAPTNLRPKLPTEKAQR